MRIFLSLAATLLIASCATQAGEILHVPIALTTPTGPGASVGEILIRNEAGGVALQLRLHGLPSGPHGFHLHANASCDAAPGANGAIAPAGGHFDPNATAHHMGPMGNGHLGDLPVLDVDAHGDATQTLHVTRFQSGDALKGHALMIHAGGDNYSDTPAPLGGGGARLACGVVG